MIHNLRFFQRGLGRLDWIGLDWIGCFEELSLSGSHSTEDTVQCKRSTLERGASNWRQHALAQRGERFIRQQVVVATQPRQLGGAPYHVGLVQPANHGELFKTIKALRKGVVFLPPAHVRERVKRVAPIPTPILRVTLQSFAHDMLLS